MGMCKQHVPQTNYNTQAKKQKTGIGWSHWQLQWEVGQFAAATTASSSSSSSKNWKWHNYVKMQLCASVCVHVCVTTFFSTINSWLVMCQVAFKFVACNFFSVFLHFGHGVYVTGCHMTAPTAVISNCIQLHALCLPPYIYACVCCLLLADICTFRPFCRMTICQVCEAIFAFQVTQTTRRGRCKFTLLVVNLHSVRRKLLLSLAVAGGLLWQSHTHTHTHECA